MTGHGVGEASLGGGRVLVEVRAVNHKFLDARVRMPPELLEHSASVEERVKKALKRGRVEVLARLDLEGEGTPVLDLARARAAFEQLCALRDELRPDEPVPLSLLASVPDLFVSRSTLDHDVAETALASATDTACAGVWRMRELEGEALARDLRANLAGLSAELAAVRARIPATVAGYRDRLRQRIDKLLRDQELSLEPARLEHEVALFADRSDVSEEITRLDSHIAQLESLLSAGDHATGKRLDFLLQEMTRETNTIGSKSSDAELARAVVEMKASVSRMREQAQNIL